MCAAALVAAALACGIGPAGADGLTQRGAAAAAPTARGSVETVYFVGRRQPPVRVVRGVAPPGTLAASREIVSFGTGRNDHVTVVRRMAEPVAAVSAAPLRQAALGPQNRVEWVAFADPGTPHVLVMRGGGALRELFSADLFGPAKPGELDRIAFAVHGAESSHGTDPRMWRPELDGPQGPMQVSAAAAIDVGGGNRFDLHENRLLGRAYLARMFRRYGNWPDALAAYNWGPGNVDQWIAGGRAAERMPLETIRYIDRVLRDALIAGPHARL